MRLRDHDWNVWRDAPGFSQRFRGTFDDDGEPTGGRWKRSDDGTEWKADLDEIYTPVQE